MNKIKKIIEISIFLFLLIIIFFSNIITTYITMKQCNFELLSNVLIKFGKILFALYILYKIVNKEKLKIKDILVLLLSLFSYFSYKYAIDKNIALYGAIGRYEGLHMLLTYYIVFLSSSVISKKYQKIIMILFLITGIYQVFIGIHQYYKTDYIFWYYRKNNFSTIFSTASGTLRNPNFYSTYILLCLVYSLGSLLNSDNKSIKIIYFLLTIYFIYGLLIGDTLSCIISFIIVGLVLLSKKINKNNIKKVLLIGFILSISLIILANLSDRYFKTKIIRKLNLNKNEIVDILKNGVDDSTGKGRIYIWKKSLEISKNNLINGIGIDNLGVVEDGGPLKYVKNGVNHTYNKVHNEYLQILVTEGIFAFISYIFLLGYVIYRHIKNKNDKLNTCLYYCFIAYLIQAITNISVINVAPFFYMIMGFIVSDEYLKIDNKNEKVSN